MADRADRDDLARGEVADHLEALSTYVLQLERDPEDAVILRRMFIAAHSLKAIGAVIEAPAVRDVAHAVEDVIAALQLRPGAFSPEVGDVLLASVDAIQESLEGSPGAATAVAIDAARAMAERITNAPRAPLRRSFVPLEPGPVPTRRALVVEISPTVGMLEEMLLSQEGFTVDAFDDGTEALNHLREAPYDLVIAGVETRGLSGIDFVAALRADPALRTIPVVMTDTEDDEIIKQRAKELGVVELVRTAPLRHHSLPRVARKAMMSS